MYALNLIRSKGEGELMSQFFRKEIWALNLINYYYINYILIIFLYLVDQIVNLIHYIIHKILLIIELRIVLIVLLFRKNESYLIKSSAQVLFIQLSTTFKIYVSIKSKSRLNCQWLKRNLGMCDNFCPWKRIVIQLPLCSRQESRRAAESGGSRGSKHCVQGMVCESGQINPRGIKGDVRRLGGGRERFLLGK